MALSLSLHAQIGQIFNATVTEKDFIGWWAVVQSEGDVFHLFIKPQGHASSFFSGEGSNNIDKGAWQLDGDRLIVTWKNGYRDVMVKEGNRVLHVSHPPGSSLEEPPSSVGHAQRINPDRVGSLLVEEPEKNSPAPASPLFDTSPSLPNRSEFIGFWEVQEDDNPSPTLFLKRGGKAFRATPNRRSRELEKGSWTLVGEEVRIDWDNSPPEILSKTAQGFRLEGIEEGGLIGGTRSYSKPVLKADAFKAREYFNLTAGLKLSPEDFIGLWEVNERKDLTYYIRVNRWGQASRHGFSKGSEQSEKKGRWIPQGNRLRVTWNDGSEEILSHNNRSMSRISLSSTDPIPEISSKASNLRDSAASREEGDEGASASKAAIEDDSDDDEVYYGSFPKALRKLRSWYSQRFQSKTKSADSYPDGEEIEN